MDDVTILRADLESIERQWRDDREKLDDLLRDLTEPRHEGVRGHAAAAIRVLFDHAHSRRAREVRIREELSTATSVKVG